MTSQDHIQFRFKIGHCLDLRVYTYMYVYMYVYIYMYIYIYIYIGFVLEERGTRKEDDRRQTQVVRIMVCVSA